MPCVCDYPLYTEKFLCNVHLKIFGEEHFVDLLLTCTVQSLYNTPTKDSHVVALKKFLPWNFTKELEENGHFPLIPV